ncbi:MAG TPA: N-acetyl-alpha-D-glucosaminyl L-malate synthase BshA [Acidobacteriota bacterium]
MEPLRIGITCYPTYGGSGVIATELGTELARRGHRVHFISYALPRRLERYTENLFFHEVEINPYPLFEYPPYSLALASKMAEVAIYERLDVLHVHYAVPHATSAYLARAILRERSPWIVTTLHGTDITLVGNERSLLPITRLSIERSDAVTAVSQYLRAATYDKLNVNSDVPIEVIPNFVDTDVFQPTSASSMVCRLLQPGEKVLCHVSNFRPVKRILDVMAVFRNVARKLPARLLLVGDGPDRSAADRYAHEHGIADQVNALGKQDSISEILACADLLLLPSNTESFGLAALEAFACGVPVIGTRTGGLPELVEHGKVGYLAEIGDVESMSRFAIGLLEDEERHAAFGAAARALAVERYQTRSVVDAYESHYRAVLEKPRKNL